MYRSITYIGRTPGFLAKLGGRAYDFEWQKSLGIGKKKEEVVLKHALNMAKWRDTNGRKMFVLE